MQKIVSLDAPLAEDDELSLADTIAGPCNLEEDIVDKVFNEYQQNELWDIVARYTDDKQEQVIREYYRNGKTLSQIARENGTSVERVRQCREAGLRKLRIGKAAKELREKFEVAGAAVFRGGFRSFKEHGNSVVEYVAIRRLELEQTYKQVVSG